MKIMMIGPGSDRMGKTGEWIRFALGAVRFLRKEGHEVVWVDDNPATLFSETEPKIRSYLEPLKLKRIEKILDQERPQGIVYAFGGCIGMHLVIFLEREGVLDRLNAKVLGTGVPDLKRYMDTEIFKKTLKDIGIPFTDPVVVDNPDECLDECQALGFPLKLRPAFALEGIGAYLVYNLEEVKQLSRLAFNLSPVSQVLLEKVPTNWVQFAVEAIHDLNKPGEVYLTGTMEAFAGGIGVHLGNSLVIAPAPTLQQEYLNRAIEITGRLAKSIGVCGSLQVRFALSPLNGEMIVLRVLHGLNRFSCLFSLIDSSPLAEINIGLCLGMTMGELENKLNFDASGMGRKPQRVVSRLPIFAKEFGGTEIPNSTMRSVGSVVFLGNDNIEALTKAFDFMSLSSLYRKKADRTAIDEKSPLTASADHLLGLFEVSHEGSQEFQRLIFKGLNQAFAEELLRLARLFKSLKDVRNGVVSADLLLEAKAAGLSNEGIAYLSGAEVTSLKEVCEKQSLQVNYRSSRTAGPPKEIGPFFASYRQPSKAGCISTYGASGTTTLLLGPGPYRIGWGSEVDQACYRTALALKEAGKSIVLLNNNPEAISQDLDRLAPICVETFSREVIEHLLKHWGIDNVIHQFCLDLPDGLEDLLKRFKTNVLGTPIESLKVILDPPSLWGKLNDLGLPLLRHVFASNASEVFHRAEEIGFPILIKLTDEALNPEGAIVYDKAMLSEFITSHRDRISLRNPLLLTVFEEGIISLEVLAISDGKDAKIFALLEHIEEFGVHNGDCATVMPTLSTGELIRSIAEDAVRSISKYFHIIGHLQVDLAVKGRNAFLTGVWPYPSINLALAEKAVGQDANKWVARLLCGEAIETLPLEPPVVSRRCYAKESVFPFSRFPQLNPILHPMMQSTGQVVGIDETFGLAYFKSQMAANPRIPIKGSVFLSARDTEKEEILEVSRKLVDLGFSLVTTEGTARFLEKRGIKGIILQKVSEGRPNIIDLIINGEVALVINIPGGVRSKQDEKAIYRAAIEHNVPLITTTSGAFLMIKGIDEIQKKCLSLAPLEV